MNEPFKIQISPMILKSIASIYPNAYRILHEFTSNSVDAAECFYDFENNAYTKPIAITITIDGKTHDYARITIEDNATGMNLSDFVNRIGNSSKLGNDKVSGCFGIGGFGFIGFCNNMTITTRLSNSDVINRIEFNSKMFESPDSEKSGEIKEERYISGYKLSEKREDCWTRIKLEGFYKHSFKEISAKGLKEDIEKHFELILKRKNISIKIVDNGRKEYKCEAFDYNKYEGGEYIKELDYLEKYRSKKFKSKDKISIPNKVKIYLKVSKGRILNRKPVFVIQGRRIAEVSEVKAFRTTSKSATWSHPNLAGYIDATGILHPTISRDDFKPDEKAKALFHALVNLEDEIREFIKGQLKLPNSNEYRNLEHILSNTLKKLTEKSKFHNLFGYESGSQWHSEKGRGFSSVKEKINIKAPKKINKPESPETDSKDSFNFTGNTKAKENENISAYSSDFKEPAHKEIIIKDVEIELSHPSKSNPEFKKGEKNSKWKRNRFQGIGIIIDCENEPPLDKNDKKLRSAMFENKIIIYKKHPMFEERAKSNLLGVQTVSSDLIFYVSLEIMTQIKTLVFNDIKNDIEDISSFFHNFSEGVYLFVSELSKLEGKNLSELKELN